MITASPAGGTVAGLAAWTAVPHQRFGYQETDMGGNNELEMIAILRKRPDLTGLCWQLIAEATERAVSRQAAERETPQSA